MELFCGVGGCAAALEGRAKVAAAFDVNRQALDVYRRNFPRHPSAARTLETLPSPELEAAGADLWWLSPPCQPFTRRGLGRDDEDPRARPFLAVLERLAEVRPPHVALENVPGFVGSRVHGRLLHTLERSGYGAVWEGLVCPSELGVPNRRRRYYLVASRQELLPFALPGDVDRRPLAAYLDPAAETAPELRVAPELLERYARAVDVVSASDPEALTACFTSAYGRSHVRSGSYLRTAAGVRRFSPSEVLRLLGFPPFFTLPPQMPAAKAWPLVGNSLSLEPVRAVLAILPGLTLPGQEKEKKVG